MEGLGNEAEENTFLAKPSLVPRLSRMRNVHAWRAWYIFSCDRDVIKIGPEFLEQKGNVLCVIQPTLHSTLGVYDIGPPIATCTCSKLPATIALFPVLSLRLRPRIIKVFLPPFYL